MSVTQTASFSQNVIISDAVGTAAAPGAYKGFANAGGTVVASTGPRQYALSDSPNGVLTAPAGSVAQLSTGPLWINTTGAAVWTQIA